MLDSGAETGRLAPGESATLDVGVVGRDLAGWCSVIGHHQMGMALTVRVTGGGSTAAADGHSVGHAGHSHSTEISPDVEPAAGFEPYDATLPPLAPAASTAARSRCATWCARWRPG